MSHFSVLVIGDNPEEQLAPYHEYECTGREDEYVIDVDKTEELREEYATYRDKKRKAKKKAMPFALWVEKWCGFPILAFGEEPSKEHKYSRIELDEAGEVVKIIGRTNPNAKWDWYSLGGRWHGFFKLKKYSSGHMGTSGAFGNAAKEGWVDTCLKSAIDIEGMRDTAAKEDLDLFDRVVKVIDGREFESWNEVLDRICGKGEDFVPALLDRAREFHRAQPVIQDMHKSPDKQLRFLWDDLKETFHGFDREAHEEAARTSALITFAVVKDGTWYERGQMGWWACVADEKDKGVWQKEFSELFDSLPDDTTLSLYDCHI